MILKRTIRNFEIFALCIGSIGAIFSMCMIPIVIIATNENKVELFVIQVMVIIFMLFFMYRYGIKNIYKIEYQSNCLYCYSILKTYRFKEKVSLDKSHNNFILISEGVRIFLPRSKIIKDILFNDEDIEKIKNFMELED